MNLSTTTTRVVVSLLIAAGLLSLEASAQWRKAALPLPYAQGYFLDIFFLPNNPNLGWACSFEGYVVRTTDGGTTWRGTRTSRPFLESIQFITDRIGYTSGPAGIYRSDDGGASWRDITPADPNSENMWGCYFLNQEEGVFLVGGCATNVQAFYRTTNGGNSWQVSFGTETNSGLSDAIIYRDGAGYAVSSGVLWRTTNFGRSWRIHNRTGAKYWTEELAVINKTFLLPTSGTDCSGTTQGIGSMRWSSDDGRTWREFQTGANMFGSFLLDETRGWGVGDDAAVYYTDDAGKSWTLRNCGIEGNMDDITFINDTLGWIAGDGLYRSDFNAPKKQVALAPSETILEICSGDSILVSASDGFSRYSWTDGRVSQSRYLSAAGTYVIRAFDKFTCQESYDTIQVAIKPSVVPQILTTQREFCEGDSAVLSLGDRFVQQRWSTGDTTETIVVRESGTYTVTTLDTNGCTKVSVMVSIVMHPNPRPQISANRSTTICLDESVTLSAPQGFSQYLWSTGDRTESITVSTAGTYTVNVIDQFGCSGTSAQVTVTVLNTRNKLGIDLASTGGVFVIGEHPVGGMLCAEITLRNRSDTEEYVIRRPFLVGNVTFSVPLAQLPVVIPPRGSRTLEICCAAVDTGVVVDTIVIPDTCSDTYLPVRSSGLPIDYEGISRCAVPVNTLVYRAGTAYRLSDPYPLPADDVVTLTVSPSRGVSALLVDVVGSVRAEATISEQGGYANVTFATSSVAPGPYVAVVLVDGQPIRTVPVNIVR